MRPLRALAAALLGITAAACATAPLPQSANAHIRADSVESSPAGRIPRPVQQAMALPPPKPAARTETYSVVVNNVRAQDLLFALARDAKINVDIHPGIVGPVTLNAIDQTLPQLLNRIAKQVDMRYELDGPNLVVMPDTPFLRSYKVDYVNMSRELTGTVSINTQIASGGAPSGGAASAGGAIGTGNVSSTSIKNESKNRFWEDLEKNIKDILRETDKILPEGSSDTIIERTDTQTTTGTTAPAARRARRGSAQQGAIAAPNPAELEKTETTVEHRATFREAASVIVNPAGGTVTVRATGRQHEKIREFLDSVLNAAKRQVLIEATIVEVALNDGYRQGIDWSRSRSSNGSTFGIAGPGLGTSSGSQVTPFVLSLLDKNSPLDINVALQFLESFGSVKVLSSPRLSVLNNQTALLKIVDSIVYFNVKADTTTNQTNAQTTVTTTPQSVSVGLVMAVTPQISDLDAVILNVRPTISSVIDFKQDPNPDIARAGLSNLVPEIRTREIESVLRVSSGDVAVLGGLMEDRVDYKTGRIPLLGAIPGLGEIVTSRNNAVQKTELVIFMRPIVVRDASIGGDYRAYREQLPTDAFLVDPQARERRLAMPQGAGRP
jgi:general secretion pathway protein D